jgi:hypothetical protein
MKTLKSNQPAFELVDGPGAGKRYVPGRHYAEAEIPAGYERRFESVKQPAAKPPKKTGDKK